MSGRVASRFLGDPGLLRAHTSHVSLAVADPFLVTDPLTVEPAGAFSRALVSWSTSDPMANLTRIVWVGLPSGTRALWVTGFTGAFNGDLTFAAPVPQGAIYFPGGGGAIIEAGDLVVGA